MSLKIKLPLLLGLTVTIPLILFTIGSYIQINNLVVKQKIQDSMNIADTKYVHILDFLDRTKADAKIISEDNNLVNSLDNFDKNHNEADLNSVNDSLALKKNDLRFKRNHPFNKKASTRERIQELFVLDSNGIVVASSDKMVIGRNLSGTKYFTRNKMAFIDVYRDKDGSAVFGYSFPIRKDGRFLGCAAIKIDVKVLQMIMTGELGNVTGGKLFFAGFSKNYDFYVMNKNGYMITQSRTTKADTVLKKKGSPEPLKRTLDSGAKGDRMTNIGVNTGAREAMGTFRDRSGVEVAGASMPVYDNLWTVVVEQSTADAFASLINLRWSLVAFFFLTLSLILVVGSVIIGSMVTEPINIITGVAESIRSGDRHGRADIKSEDEIGALADAFNDMNASLNEFIASDRNVRSELELLVNRYINTVLQTKDQATIVNESAKLSQDMSSDGRQAVSDTISTMDEIKSSVTEIAGSSDDLMKSIKVIGSIITTVSDLTEQSNLLAINASIEASRAGEKGKGFGIVAANVKKLAEQSRAATEQVSKHLQTIRNSSETVAQATVKGKKMADEGMIIAQRASQSIATLQMAINDNARSAGLILDYAAEIDDEKKNTEEGKG